MIHDLLASLARVSPFVFGLRVASVFCIAFGLALAAFTVGRAPTRVASRLGLRGLNRQKAMTSNELWRGIDPVVRWLGVRLSGILSDEQRASFDRQISLAGDYMGLTADEYLALFLMSSVAGSIFGAFAGWAFELGAMLVIVGVVLGAALPYLAVSGQAQQRMREISQGLPYVIDLMALSMGAGLDFPGALRQVIEKSSNPNDPIVEEFTLILQTVNLGRTRKDALLEFAKRVPASSVTEFVNALVQAEERGNPVAEVLQIQAGTARARRSVGAEELASKAGVKMTFPLMLIFFAVITLIVAPAMMTITEGL